MIRRREGVMFLLVLLSIFILISVSYAQEGQKKGPAAAIMMENKLIMTGLRETMVTLKEVVSGSKDMQEKDATLKKLDAMISKMDDLIKKHEEIMKKASGGASKEE